MPIWHAYADRSSLISGTGVLITGGHERVRVQIGDQMSVEMPDGNRVSGVVVDRNQDKLLMYVGESPLVRLHPSQAANAFEGFKLSDGFSRQCWTVQ